MSTMTKAGFRPSDSLICAAEAVLLGMTIEQMVRPVVEGYETEILAKHRFMPAQKFAAYVENKPIVNRKDAFLMGEDDMQVYLKECFAARDAAGLQVSRPDNCPLLEAESMRVRAENALIRELGEIAGLEAFRQNNHVMTLEQRAKVVAIGLKLTLPFVGKPEEILGSAMSA